MIIKNIQILRAFAVISVVLFHSFYAIHEYKFLHLADNLFSWGKYGVDIFFVISGFVMVYIQNEDKKNFFNFIIKRIKRILPAYWFYNFVILILFILFPSIFKTLSVDFNNFFFSLIFLSQLILQNKPILTAGWTLEYEMAFYILFAIFMNSKNIKLSFFFLTITIIFLVSFSFLDFLFIEFVFGMLIGIIYIEKNGLFKSIIKKYSLFFLIIGFSTFFISNFIFQGTHRVLAYGIPSVFIVLGSVFAKQISNKYFIFLGDASYSIYLSHIFIVIAILKLFKIFYPDFNGIIILIILISSSLLFGSFMYYFIERNLNSLVKNL